MSTKRSSQRGGVASSSEPSGNLEEVDSATKTDESSIPIVGSAAKRKRNENDEESVSLHNTESTGSVALVNDKPSFHRPFLRRTMTCLIVGAQLDGNAAQSKKWLFHRVDKTKGRTTVWTKKRKGTQCPVCEDFDAVCLEGVWIHCSKTHGEYTYKPIMATDGMFHILARPVVEQEGPTPPPKGTSELIYWHSRPDEFVVSEVALGAMATVTREMKPPLRQYVHPDTRQPLTLGEWVAEYDSDNDVDETWQRRVNEAMMDDFDDVSAKEKSFFKLWNAYMRENRVISQISLQFRAIGFINDHVNELKQGELHNELILHLTNMWDEGHISRSQMLTCMARYNALIISETAP